ncbi:GMC family oxidoreductase [Streptomyces sp. NPDC046881]|uniref:GMC family oxidoreductase n=1 Tax=Streptomyces sp. NPDC046881 TaxID=3155374 RepID=UPI0033D1FD46
MESFDAVVIGSGFGGSVMTARLAEAHKRVCLLERGRAYAPGTFPRGPHATASNFWAPDHGLYGMFDVWSFSELDAVVCSGLGGGSLIYANVLLRKPENWFPQDDALAGSGEYWPIGYKELVAHYERVEQAMGVQRYPTDHEPYRSTPKTLAMQEAAQRLGLEWELPHLAVTFGNPGEKPVPGVPVAGGAENRYGVPRYTCRLVGECDIGCNFGSKNTLDLTYLGTAEQKHGAVLRTGCEVKSFTPTSDGFLISYLDRRLDRAEGERDTAVPRVVRAHRLILAAGALGTPYLLLRNRSRLPDLGPALGTRFSGNGDFLGFVLKSRQRDGGQETPRLLHPSFGPVITSAMRSPDRLDGGTGRGFFIEDAGYPDFINWLVEQNALTASGHVLRFLLRRGWSRLTHSPRSEVGRQLSDALSKGLFTATSLPLLGMGRDMPTGRMRLRDGHLDLDWDTAASDAYFHRMNGTMRALSSALGGCYASDPLSYLNRLITVHPLGGAPMGRNRQEGVVDSYGRVYGCPGLSIVDGSIMPGPVGANPSLTIAALADRAADAVIDDLDAEKRRSPARR